MSRKLICLISTKGKTLEGIAKEMMEAYRQYQNDPENFKPLLNLEESEETRIVEESTGE